MTARHPNSRFLRRSLAKLSLAVLSLTVPLSVPALAQTTALCATPGKDGPLVVPAGGVVNTYYPGTANVAAGGTSLTLGTPVGNTAQGISAGDLLLVMQMQDAATDSSNTNSYGDGVAGDPASGATNVNAAGQYEFVVAQGAVAAGATGTVTVRGTGSGNGLLRAYTNADATGIQGQRRYQVIRVPQYSSATFTSALTAAPWNGTAGGVLAMDVAGTANLNGAAVSVSGLGFRGGGGRNLQGGTATTTSTAPTNTDFRYATSPLASTAGRHGSKGEGTAGTPRVVNSSLTLVPTVTDTGAEGYPQGSAGQGAPGNAGGGGTDDSAANANNSGGGGGSNGGAGGQGGDSYNTTDTVTNPNTGGFGGADFTSAGTARVVLGGGGGAGSSNNNFAGTQTAAYTSGARGGGVLILRAGTLTGSGTLSANGLDAADYAGNDAAGGGGAGGSVLVYAASSTATLTANAGGGAGGDADITTFTTPHGPGGGGGGGVVYTNVAATTSVAGGANGRTPLSAATTFTAATSSAFGAAAGSPGETGTLSAQPTDTGAGPTAACVPVLSVLKTTSTPIRTLGTDTTATYTVTVSNAAGRADATGVTLSDTLPTPFTYASTGAVTLGGGATRPSSTTPAAGAAVPSWGTFTLPGGGSVALTFTVNLGAAAGGTYQNPATATYLDPARTAPTGTATASYDTALTGEDVTVGVLLSGRVFGDPNYNGSVDTGETGLSGVTVGLYDAAGTGLIRTATTDASGNYSFAVAPSTTYTVRATGPSGQGPTNPSPASRSVAVGTASSTGQNFGFATLPTCSTLLATGFTGTGAATLYTVNTASGALTPIRTLTNQTAAMARDPNTGRVYYVGYATYASTAPQLRYVDLATGEDALAATLATETTAITRMAIDKNGTGYAMIGNGSKLFSFTTGGTTSTVTNLGSVTTSSGVAIANYGTGDMAFDDRGVLWAVFTDSTAGSATLNQAILFTIDPATRVATPVDNVTVGGNAQNLTLNGLAFDPGGSLYASSGLTNGSYDIYQISPANANGTKLNAAANTLPTSDLASCVYPSVTPAVTITKAASPQNAKPGDTITYTITVTNSGTAAATAATLTDVLPTNTTYVAGSTTTNGAATADGAGGTMPYASGGQVSSPGSFPSVIAVGPGKEVVVVFKVTVNNPYPDGAAGVSNTANVTYSGGPAGGLTSPPATTGVGTDLRVTKTGPQYVPAGRAVSYTVTVTNAGLRAAGGAAIRDPAVANFTATGVACTASGGAVCPTGLTVATLQSGAAITTFPAGGALTLTVTGTAGTGTIVNAASVTAPATLPDLDGSNNDAAATTQIINLVLTKEVRNCGALAPGAACPASAPWSKTGAGRPGDVLEYRISYTNTGTANARGVLIQDDVPGNTAADLSGYAAGRGVSWTVGTGAPTLLTSAVGTPTRDDAGSLTAAQLILDVGLVAPGAGGSVSFRSVIK